MDYTILITAGLALIAALFGLFYARAKGKLSQVASLAKEAVDVLQKATDILADDVVTKEEIEALKQEIAEVRGAFRLLFPKKEQA